MPDAINITYIFAMEDGATESFPLRLDPVSLGLLPESNPEQPPWTRLDFHQCPNCRDMEGENYCPVAVGLARIVHRFAAMLSYETIELTVITAEREIRQSTTIQRAISSYMGLVMATCGCPNTRFLRPMARFHLPLASEEETLYRALSMYALAQYFTTGNQSGPDLAFTGLEKAYNELQQVNQAIVQRLRAASDKDSSINALINLDMYAKAMPLVIKDSLEELHYLFIDYPNLLEQKISDAPGSS